MRKFISDYIKGLDERIPSTFNVFYEDPKNRKRSPKDKIVQTDTETEKDKDKDKDNDKNNESEDEDESNEKKEKKKKKKNQGM